MTDRQTGQLLGSLMYEVLQATTMLLFLLSSIATNRRKQYEAPGVARPVVLSGLPEICLAPCIIQVPDDDLYGPTGAAAQIAYKGWIAQVFGYWENRSRKDLQDSLGQNAIRPEMEAFGDLRLIRNDLLHTGTATKKNSGKCVTLKWFKPGQKMVFETRHVLDFLNQTGLLSLGGRAHDPTSITTRSCLLEVYEDEGTLLKWTPEPKIVSVRTHEDAKNADPPYKGVTVAFDNGLFANLPFKLAHTHQWVALGDAHIQGDGNIVFADGTVIDSGEIYRATVAAREPRKSGDGRPRLPVAGPWIRFRR